MIRFVADNEKKKACWAGGGISTVHDKEGEG